MASLQANMQDLFWFVDIHLTNIAHDEKSIVTIKMLNKFLMFMGKVLHFFSIFSSENKKIYR